MISLSKISIQELITTMASNVLNSRTVSFIRAAVGKKFKNQKTIQKLKTQKQYKN